MDRKAFNFFRENAGGIVGQRALGAARLARAEAWLLEQVEAGRMRVRWESDDDADLSWMDEAERGRIHEVEGCIIESCCASCGAWTVAESLWAIVDADADYRRVVEAELASERAA